MGPICSRRYYDPLHVPNADQIKVALGLLQASGLPKHIIDGFLACVDNLEGEEKDNARKACNLLIYWASCCYHDRDVVFCCASIIRALGYSTLADKLEIDRTSARIEDKGDRLHVMVGKKMVFVRDMKRIPGATKTDEVSGDKTGWVIPVEQKDHFMAVLGYHYGNGLACGGGNVFIIPYKGLRDLMYFRRRPAAQAISTPVPTPVPVSVPSVSVEKENPILGRMRLLFLQARKRNDEWLMEFLVSVAAKVKRGDPLTDRQQKVLDQNLSRYGVILP